MYFAFMCLAYNRSPPDSNEKYATTLQTILFQCYKYFESIDSSIASIVSQLMTDLTNFPFKYISALRPLSTTTHSCEIAS